MEPSTVKINNILYATDLSESAQHAFSYAVSLANQYGARITFLTVLPETPSIVEGRGIIGYIGEERWKELEDSQAQEAKDVLIGKRKDHLMVREILGRFSEKTRSKAENRVAEGDEIVVEQGDPVDVILAVAKEKKCDLIVMGTHGRGPLADALMGGTVKQVIRRSKTPVLVVRLPKDV